MELKKLLENKPKLKENLATYVLKSGVFNDLLKTGRKSAEQIVLMKLEEKIYSMNEHEIIEYFDSTDFMSRVSWTLNLKTIEFHYVIEHRSNDYFIADGNDFKTRKEATIECAKKLIELSN